MMRVFLLRVSFFSLLWIYTIFTGSKFIPLSILFFTLALGIYFLLSVRNAQLWKYFGLLLLIGLHGFYFIENPPLIALIILYIMIDASFRLERRKLLIFLLITGGSLSFYYLLDALLTLDRIVFYLLFGFLVVTVNQQLNTRREQRDVYAQLLGEYRTLNRLQVTAEENARLAERTRIARDIHDSVGHRLTALIMKLEMLSIEKKTNEYDQLKEIAKESLEETRQAVQALQIEESEGIATVVHLIRKLEGESHLRIQFTLNHGALSIPVTNEMSVALYRVIQEALTNIMRHSESREAHVTLSKSAIGDILFEIANPVRNPQAFMIGFGLKNMRARVEEVSGQFRVQQTKEQFIVSGTIPKGGA